MSTSRPQHLCDSTVAPPLPSFRVTLCDLLDGSGEVRTTLGSIVEGRCPGHRPAPKNLGFLKTIVIMILLVGMAVSAISHRILLCMHYACYSTSNKGKEPSNASKATTTDQTDQEEPKKTPKPEREAEGVGSESGT